MSGVTSNADEPVCEHVGVMEIQASSFLEESM